MCSGSPPDRLEPPTSARSSRTKSDGDRLDGPADNRGDLAPDAGLEPLRASLLVTRDKHGAIMRPIPLCVLLSTVCPGCMDAVAAVELSAGVSRVDLTPPAEMKAPLGGYGARRSRPAEGVHDRILAKAVVVSDGTRKFAMVTADMLGFAPPIKPAVLDRLKDAGWNAEQILLLPSHSHASIEMNAINPRNIYRIPEIGIHDQRLFELTVERLARVVRQAEQELVPVKIGTSARPLPGWNRNRRRRDGATDEQLTVTRIDRTDGKPLAVLVSFAAHPTFMTERQMLFSAGWPGHLQRTLEALVGDGVTAMYYNGAEGDLRPRARPGSGSSRWEQAERYGRELALVAHERWRATRTERAVVFGYHRQPIDLPDRVAHPDFMKTGGEEYGLSETMMEEFLPRMLPAGSASVSLRLGDLLVIGVPGEMAAALGLEVKARAARLTNAKYPVIGGLADEWISYILSEEQYQEGGYEASVSFYGPSLSRHIVDGVLEGVRRLGPQSDSP